MSGKPVGPRIKKKEVKLDREYCRQRLQASVTTPPANGQMGREKNHDSIGGTNLGRKFIVWLRTRRRLDP